MSLSIWAKYGDAYTIRHHDRKGEQSFESKGVLPHGIQVPAVLLSFPIHTEKSVKVSRRWNVRGASSLNNCSKPNRILITTAITSMQSTNRSRPPASQNPTALCSTAPTADWHSTHFP